MKAPASSSSPHLARRQGFARCMREQPTASERALWAALSGGKLGVSFRRQVVVGASIVDFLAPARKLVVEVDGGYHGSAERQRSDARRDKRLERAGYNVLRIPATLVVSDVQRAVQLVRLASAVSVRRRDTKYQYVGFYNWAALGRVSAAQSFGIIASAR